MSSSFNSNEGMSPQTQAALSMRNKIFTDNYATSGTEALNPLGSFVGALGSFSPSQSRGTQEVRGIGMGDRILEAVPNYHDMFSISTNRTLFYLSNIFEVFGYKSGVNGLVRALHHHKHPFRIRQELVLSEQASIAASALNSVSTEAPGGIDATLKFGGLAAQAVITHYLGCWFDSYSVDYSSDSSIVSEQGNISCPEISDGSSIIADIFADTGNTPLVTASAITGVTSAFAGTATALI